MTTKNEDEKLQELESRFQQLDYNRRRFTSRWSEAQNFVASTTISWDSLDTVPEVPNRYSSIPCNYLNTLVNGLSGYSISPNIIWFKLSLENPELLEYYGVKDWLENVESIMLAEFNRSNLYSQAVQFITDAAVIGHGVMLCDEDIQMQKLRFTKLPANEVYLDVNASGEVDTVFRRYVMTIRNMVRFFGEDKVDPQVKADYKDVEKWNNLVEILECVFPREEYNIEHPDAKNKPYAAIFIDRTHHSIIDESGYDDMPYAVFHWERFSGYAYGSSPAQSAIADIKGLNIAKKTSWQIAQTSAEPPMKVSEDIRQVNITPRGYTYVTGADQILEPVRTGENYPITLQVLQDMKQDIRDWFYVDFFLMLQQKTAQMTATEVMELQGEKAATLSNLIVNLNEALTKIIQRSFNILMKAGRLPEIPGSLIGTSTAMKVDFVGPLAQAQKKYHTLGGTSQALSSASAVLQLFPNAGDFIDGDELMKSILEGNGMPQNVIRENEDVKKIRELRAQEQAQLAAQQQQLQMTENIMKNADKLGKVAEPGSMMGTLNSQLAGSLNGGRQQ